MSTDMEEAERMQFKKELREIMTEKKEMEIQEARRKYDAWIAQQEELRGEKIFEREPDTPTKASTTTTSSTTTTAGKQQSDSDDDPAEPALHMGPKDTHFDFGIQFQNENQMEDLIKTLQESLKLQLMSSPYASTSVAQSFEELGILYHQKMDFVNAIKHYRHALLIHEKLARHKANNLGELIQLEEEISTSASKLEKQLKGEMSVVTNNITNDNEFDYSFVTDVMSGGEVENQEIRKAVGSYDVARILSYLGVCYRDSGKLEKAKELLQASLKMKYATVGQYHESTGETLNNLGAMHHAEGNFREAAECYEDCIRILIGSLGVDSVKSPYVAMSYYNLGVAYKANNSIGPAIVALSKALRVCGSGLGKEHEMYERIAAELEALKNEETIDDPSMNASNNDV